jgi:hypothetical protein
MQGQEEDNWCWLAVAASVADLHALSGRLQQCQLAQNLVPNLPAGTTCCANPAPAECDVSGDSSLALHHVGHSQGSYMPLAPFQDIEREIRAGNPVVLQFVYNGSTVEHVVAVVDTQTNAGTHFLVIADPDGPFTDRIPHGSGTWRSASVSWSRTYYTCP